MRYSVLPALTIDGYLAEPLICEGGVTAELFTDWFEAKVIPQLAPDAIVTLDNAKIHHSAAFKDLCTAHGVRAEYLPPYLPDYNPIEQSFNALKAWVKRHISELSAFPDFPSFIQCSIEQLSVEVEAKGWFAKAGYRS
jgi:transposase